ncbi:MAG TPA: hypothetical protein VHU82_13195 [Vicinamibacterales bacterium]|jgi:hypothetical protein|nr:hypothetical protein [Vicinamibacterales bacterium]
MQKLSINVPLVVIAAAMLIALGSASEARAQETKLVAHVPFAFIVGSSVMPAGEYVVKDDSDNSSVLAIASADGKRFVNTLTIPSSLEDTTGQSSLVFDKVGGQYFLARVTPAGREERELLINPAAAEREVAVDLTTR